MTDNEETSEPAKKSEDPNEQSALPEIKMCMVQLEKIDFKGFLNNESDVSDDDLPALPYLLPKSKKIQISNKELLEEYENLARNIQVGNSSDHNVEEKLKMISIVDTDEVEVASSSPPTIVNEEKDIKVFLANDTLQFFNICDVTFEQCGYDSTSADLTEFEKIMLSFKRIELDHVLSSFLISCDIHFISDLKSFILFLLRNLSVHTDLASVKACYDALTFILIKHPDAKMLNFSSAEMFMLLFSYGTDISSFKFLKKRMDIQSIWNHLEEPKDKSRNKIPDNWVYNLKTTLNAVAVLMTNCEFKFKHLCDIIIYLLFMSLDDSLLNENLFSTIGECINVGLDHIPADKWPKALREIARAFITDDFVNSQDQWGYLFHVAESVPVTSKRGTELRKYISYLALTLFGEIQLYSKSPGQRVEVNKALNGFSLYELQSLLKRIIQNGSDAVINFATKFLNICISYLDATDEELFKQLCDMLKDSECVLNERSHEAKAHFLKIHARLMIRFGGNSGYKVLTEEDEGLRKKIKKEVDIDKDPCSSYPLVKVKKEPGIIEQSNLPSEKMCTSQDSRTLMNNNECVTTTYDTVLSSEKSISVENNTIFEEVNVKIEALTTQAILDIQSIAAEGQESGMNTSSAQMEELVIDGSDLTNNNIQENGAITSSTIIKSASSLDDGKLCTNEYILSMKFQSRMNSSRKINSKRKSISNDRNLPLPTHSIEHDDNKEIVLILNDILETVQKKDDVCEASQCTPTSNSATQFNSSSNLSPFSVTSLSSPHLTVEPELSSPNSMHQSIQNQAEAEEISPVCSHSNLTEGNNNENNISRPETSKRPVFESIDKSPHESSPRISESQSPKKRKNSECSSLSHELQSERDECRLSSNKKLKSSDDQQSRVNSDRTVTSSSPDHLTLETNLTNHNSMLQNIENEEETEEMIAKCSQSLKSNLVEGLKKLNKEDILTSTGLELTTVLRQNLASNSSNQVPSSTIVEVASSSDSDSDILELYADPRNYADKECLLIYDSHNTIVLDDSD